MRVIAGQFRRRRLRTIRSLDVRPTPDRLREALFNVLAPRLPGCTFLDAYAGCGAVGIEALSRGAARVIFIERKRAAAQTIRENLRALGVTSTAEVHCGKVSAVLPRLTSDIVFLDPPYNLDREYEIAFGLLAPNPPLLVIAQHARKQPLREEYGRLRRVRVLRQGDNALSFYEPGEE